MPLTVVRKWEYVLKFTPETFPEKPKMSSGWMPKEPLAVNSWRAVPDRGKPGRSPELRMSVNCPLWLIDAG
jgi:hypothetical protein